MARQNCEHVFPNYDLRFEYPGKVGQIELFEAYNVAHPVTKVADASVQMNVGALDLAAVGYPLVCKRDWGGEGFTVFWIEDQAALETTLLKISSETAEAEQLLLQKAIPANGGRVMRVVCVGNFFKAYWRVASDPNEKIVHLEEGGRVDDHQLDSDLLLMAKNSARQFCADTGINLVGIDFLFDFSMPDPRPLIIELNYFFGRKGLGGSSAYYAILTREIQKWCRRILA
jgi:ribosomal protein S6--L-glutamate ligase